MKVPTLLHHHNNHVESAMFSITFLIPILLVIVSLSCVMQAVAALSLSQERVLSSSFTSYRRSIPRPFVVHSPSLSWTQEQYSSSKHVYKGMSLFMKQRLNSKQRKVRASNLLKNTSTEDGTIEIPQNLRRKAVAKRPTLGHVVPSSKNVKRGQGQDGGSSSPKLRPQGKERADGINNPSNLKILGGIARGRRLDSPQVYLRPMMGKVREAVYSTFTSFGLYEEGVATRHLDIFSGSGSVGLESLSRGSVHCTFVDLARDCCDTVERNIQICQFDDDESKTRVVCADAIEALKDPVSVGIPEGFTYNLVTLCPPYEEIVYADLLDAVANSPAVTDDTVILIEYPVELGCLPHVIKRGDGGLLVGVRNRKYGRTVIALYVVNPTGKLETAESRPEEFVSF